jgi:hypothetical protein
MKIILTFISLIIIFAGCAAQKINESIESSKNKTGISEAGNIETAVNDSTPKVTGIALGFPNNPLKEQPLIFN